MTPVMEVPQIPHAASYQSRIRVMVFNTIFNNIPAISWLSVLLVEETGLSKENHRHVASQVTDKLYSNAVSSSPCHE